MSISGTASLRSKVSGTVIEPGDPRYDDARATHNGMVFPTFRNDLFVAALGGVSLLRITLDASDPHKVASIDRLMQGKYGRLREVVSGPDGFIYLSTSNRDQRTTPNRDDDRILRLVPVQ